MSNFDSNIIKNPEIFEQNRLAAHSDHVCYKNELEKIKGKSSLRYDMNGLWKFAYAKNQSLAPCGFEAADYDCKNWDEIRVPAHIQMEGYDVPIYTNTTYPWEADESIKPGEVPEIFNPVASYVKYFTIPENMKNKRVCISFQGVESGFALWLNGHYVGYSEDTFDPSDFELTDYIVEGENKLAVRVWKWTSSSWCEDQDFYRFSGIYRDVFLYAVPCAHVEDLSVVPTLNDTFDEGTLSVSIKADGDGIASVKLYELGDLSVEKYDRAKLLLEEFDIELRDKEICEGSCNVKNPLLWSAEKPNLYEVKIIVKDTHGNETEFISQLAGFRRFEMVDGLMKLNGKRIVFKGVNRHEFSSITGRVPNRNEVIKDIVTMKKNNINAVFIMYRIMKLSGTMKDIRIILHLCSLIQRSLRLPENRIKLGSSVHKSMPHHIQKIRCLYFSFKTFDDLFLGILRINFYISFPFLRLTCLNKLNKSIFFKS